MSEFWTVMGDGMGLASSLFLWRQGVAGASPQEIHKTSLLCDQVDPHSAQQRPRCTKGIDKRLNQYPQKPKSATIPASVSKVMAKDMKPIMIEA